ncbi:hypothetical protein TNCV_445271 [Trichonephila clavipes]|nr:hypothetical protein TNCV_445271 [Trichonephila clavipes]
MNRFTRQVSSGTRTRNDNSTEMPPARDRKKLYEKHLAAEKWKFVVTLDEPRRNRKQKSSVIPFDEIPVKSLDASPTDFCAFGSEKRALGKGHPRTLNDSRGME